MGKTPAPKSDSDFWKEALEFFLTWGDKLRPAGSSTDKYNDHSVIKLLAMTYWVGIFVPIVRTKLVEPYGYSMVYLDTMAGSGVTETARKGDFFVGSCTAAWIAAERMRHPFDAIIAVEPNAKRAQSLRARLQVLLPTARVRVFEQELEDVSAIIHGWFEKKATSFAFIDPEGFDGMTWAGLEPILGLKGDAMVTWFEKGAFRLKEAALSQANNASANRLRLDDLFGQGVWRGATSAQELTDLFCRRVEGSCKKLPAQQFTVEVRDGEHYKVILFAGEGCPEDLPARWLSQMKRRVRPGMDIATLIDLE